MNRFGIVWGRNVNHMGRRSFFGKETKQNKEEMQYLNLLRDVLKTGVQKTDRTGVGTFNKFGSMMRFSLRDGRFPLLTTKKVFWRGVVEELLWMLRGQTDSKLLSEKGIHIWKGNSTKEFLDNRGLGHLKEGDCGSVYGFQWRHWGAPYENCDTNYENKGIDQIADVIHQLKNNPTSRRILLTAWNPSQLSQMVLPPCHAFCQFTVNNKDELSCLMYQRSADLFLGVPFNIASYSLLTRILAHHCNLKPGEFIHCLGDAHIYKTHIEAVTEQLKRNPYRFPTLLIERKEKEKVKEKIINVTDYQFDDFVLNNYNSHPPIKAPMAI